LTITETSKETGIYRKAIKVLYACIDVKQDVTASEARRKEADDEE